MSNRLNAVGMDNVTGQFNIADPNDTFMAPALAGMSGTPSLTVGPAAGSSPTASIVGSNLGGQINLKTGVALLTSGVVLTMTYANSLAFPNGSAVVFSPGNAAFAAIVGLLSVVGSASTAVLSVSAGLSINTTYIGYYQIVGY